MAVVPPEIILILQMAGAMVLVITGIIDRLEASEQPANMSFPLRYIALPVWVGALIAMTAACGFAVRTKVYVAKHSALVLVYKALSITSSILCGFILFWYGEVGVAVYAARFALRQNADGFYYFSDDLDEDTNLSHLTTISVMALIELFLSILGALTFQDRSAHTQLLRSSMDPYYYRKQNQIPPRHSSGKNSGRSEGIDVT